jgi:hypothetical protein
MSGMRGTMDDMDLELPVHGAAGARIASELREAILAATVRAGFPCGRR